MTKKFLSGNEAFAIGISLAKPAVISAYPITPQTIVVEKLSDMVSSGELKSEFIHVESEHSALSCAIGASAVGVRTFTATSSQGLLYMAECLPYAAGGRFPIVMMNANRSTALPWNIYGDQRDSIGLLDLGWIQAYAENAQESLDLAIMSYYIAEHKDVSTPYMANLDGFVLTHTYEEVEIPTQEQVDSFLPPYETENKMDVDTPTNMCFSAGPEYNYIFKYKEHEGINRSIKIIKEAEEKFAQIFGRKYTNLVESYLTDDADFIIVTLGSVSGICKEVADTLREQNIKAGVLRIRYLRPFSKEVLANHLKNAKSIAVLEKDISFGNEGTVYSNVCSALQQANITVPTINFVGGLGGQDITTQHINSIYEELQKISNTNDNYQKLKFLGLEIK